MNRISLPIGRQAQTLGRDHFHVVRQELQRLLPNIRYEEMLLAEAPIRAILSNKTTAAVDLFKNLPAPLGPGVDWFWLTHPKCTADSMVLLFRSGDLRWLRIRSLFVKSVVFAGAGPGAAETCTLGALEALERCDVCLHDSLIDPVVLQHLSADAEVVNVGKRCGVKSIS